jgi:hypothetical protein
VKYPGYTFWGQVDPAWVFALTLFHLFISIVLNVAFITILMPRHSGQSLIGRFGIILCLIFFLGFNLLVALVPLYRSYRLTVYIVGLLLLLIAFFLPPAKPRSMQVSPAPGLWKLRFAGFSAMFTYLILIYFVPQLTAKVAGPALLPAQGVDIIIFILFGVFLVWRGYTWTMRSDWSLRQTSALISGSLTFSVLFSLVFGWTVAEPVVTIPFFALLVWLEIRLRK